VKILIDECVDQRLRFLLSGHDCETAAYAKFTGLKNGALLAAAEAADFAVIITTDQEIPFQQNMTSRKISVIVLCAPTNRLADLRPLVPAAIEALHSIKPGQVIRIA
jgi:predicted nuclease of predicted toxin-antitoxin system